MFFYNLIPMGKYVKKEVKVMKRSMLFVFLLIMAVWVFGCAATARLIDYSSMKTDVAMSESIFLAPSETAKKVYVEIRNTSSDQNITDLFKSTVLSGIQGKGCELVQKPSQASYILQANIRYLGELKEGMNFQGTLTGTGLGALAGLGIGGPHHFGSGAAVGGLIGAGIGLAVDALTRVKTQIIVIEFQITERLSEEEDFTGQKVEKTELVMDEKVMGGIGIKPDSPTSKSVTRHVTSKKAGTNIYNAGVAARAAQVNLNTGEAAQRLIETAALQIVGIF